MPREHQHQPDTDMNPTNALLAASVWLVPLAVGAAIKLELIPGLLGLFCLAFYAAFATILSIHREGTTDSETQTASTNARHHVSTSR